MIPKATLDLLASATCKQCGHDKTELRHRLIANGSSQIVFQCLRCGRSATNPLSKSLIPNYLDLPDWDDSLPGLWDQQKHSAYVQERQEGREEFFRQHDEYLQTAEWRRLRELVMQRASGTCEGCRTAPATEVHHLTYDNWKAEFLWELVAICHGCHERFHIAKAKAIAEREWKPE